MDTTTAVTAKVADFQRTNADRALKGLNDEIATEAGRGNYGRVARVARQAAGATVTLAFWGHVVEQGWDAAGAYALTTLNRAVAELDNDEHAAARADTARGLLRTAACNVAPADLADILRHL